MDNASTSESFSLEDFDKIANGNGIPTGKLNYLVDRGYVLTLNDYAESSFMKLLAGSGYALSIRGQSLAIPYYKPWASNPSPYYPDLIVYTYEKKIAFIEIKSILGMCQDENIVKFKTLFSFAKRNGYLSSFIDSEKVSILDYYEDPPDEDVKRRFDFYMRSQGGFNDNNLASIMSLFPKKKPSLIKRSVASLILQDPYISNRYTHDSPYLLNAVRLDSPLPYKM